MTKEEYRTVSILVIYKGAENVICTPSEVDFLPGSLEININDLPEKLQNNLLSGDSFMAEINVLAKYPPEFNVRNIQNKIIKHE